MLLMALLSPLSATPPRLAATPLPLSSVSLLGDWAARETANRDVLMSLNLTEWACHFTTAANLTSCKNPVGWQTYIKDAHNSSIFSHKTGFLNANDDVQPPATESFARCKAFCVGAPTCLGFTFESEAAVPTVPVRCYWKRAIHLTPLRSNCIADGGPGQPLCQPLPGEMGLGGYYGHYQGHWLSSTALLINSTGNATVKARADGALQTLSDVMDAWRGRYGDDWGDGYLFPYDVVAWRKLLSGAGSEPDFPVPVHPGPNPNPDP